MAVSATFLADFTSFTQQVERAEVKLRDFGRAAGSIDKDLSRVGNSFSGQRVIQEATLAARAIEEIGGVSKLTASEQTRLSGTVSEAIAKFQALGQQAPASVTALHKALQPVSTEMHKATAALDSFKTGITSMASGVALGNIAAQGLMNLASSVGTLVAQGVRMGPLEGSFKRLTASIGETDQAMLRAVRQGTRGLVADLELMQATNKAILLGLPVTAAEMRDLTAAATTLGQAMGQDATKSVDDFITALGRSSPQILDNLGLSVKLAEANETYARALGKTALALTDAEKKQAFFTAAMEAARTRTKELGDQASETADAWDRMWVRITNAARQVGNVGAGAVESLLLSSPKGGLVSAKTGARQQPTQDEVRQALMGENAKLVASFAETLRGKLTPIGGSPFSAVAPTEDEIARLKKVTEPLANAVKAAEEAARVTEWLQNKWDKIAALDVFPNAGAVFQEPLARMAQQQQIALDGLLSGTAASRSRSQALLGFVPSARQSGTGSAGGFTAPGVGFFGGMKGGVKDMWKGMSGGGGMSGLFSNIGTDILSGGINSLMNAGISLATKGLGKLFGGIFKSEGKKTNNARDEAFGSLSGFEEVAKKAAAAGVTMDAVLGAKKVKDFEAAWASLTSAIEKQQAILEQYGVTWTDFKGPEMTKRMDEEVKRLTSDYDALIRAGLDHDTAVRKVGPSFIDMSIAAVQAGQDIPAALAPMIRDLALAGQLTKDQAAALLGMGASAGPTFKQMEEAAARYGIELDKLGRQYKQLKVDEFMKQAEADFKLLTEGGADATTIISGMGDEFNAMVLEALKGGLAIPDSMRPILQKMIEQGQLTDEAGVKLEDLSRIDFATPLITETDKLILKLDELIQSFRGAIGLAESLSKVRIGGAPAVEMSPLDDGGLEVHPMANGGRGVVTRPTLFLAGEAGAEEYAFSGAGRRFGSDNDAVVSELRAQTQRLDSLEGTLRRTLQQLPLTFASAQLTRGAS